MRHTETVWNTEERYQGVIDAPLSKEGEREIDTIAASVRPGNFDRVYTSPLSRAHRLAERVAGQARVPLMLDDRLLEIHLGPWQGLTRAEIKVRFPEMFREWYQVPDQVHFPGGESLTDVEGRIWNFVEERFSDPTCRRTLAVSHDSVIKVALMLALGLDLARLHAFRLRNGSISVLKGASPDGSVESLDVTSHLTGSPFAV
ncbi:MAG TPA: histidine phosphatase family protein [Chloroflexota bacterium]|nr:histidine phosphatase family protein [Chloroflexota bacterium]